MPRQNVSDLLAFRAVARERSFTRAAAQIGVSTSALSYTIRGLEERLGIRLLTRTTRSVVPTEAGERLLGAIGPHFDGIEAELAALEAGETRWTPEAFAAAGAVVSLDPWGEGIRVERGFVRGEDAMSAEPANDDAEDDEPGEGAAGEGREDDAEDDRAPALSGALRAELLAHRTAMLRALSDVSSGLAGCAAHPSATV